jgi:CDP-glycerol glycerophosphotransferase (TagB/SpsB family)
MDGGTNGVLNMFQKIAKENNVDHIRYLYTPQGEGIKEILAASDIMVSTRSSVVTEALLLGTEIICLEQENRFLKSWENYITIAPTPAELTKALRNLIQTPDNNLRNRPGYWDVVKDISYSLDGGSMDRLMTEINNLVKGGY